MQEDKEGFFDAADTLLNSLNVFQGMLATMKIRGGAMARAAEGSFATATDLADYLAKKGMPFRQAHEVVGKMVRYAIDNNKVFAGMSLEEYKQFSTLFEEDARQITTEASLNARQTYGGTAPAQVQKALEAATALLDGTRDWLKSINPE
jgi:argininosuccinate lyase